MRVMVLGLRGFPGIQGGVETHAEHLYPLLVKLGCEVDVIVRSQYMPGDIGDTWRGVRFRRLWSPCPRMKGIERGICPLFFRCVVRSLKEAGRVAYS